jgi:hypothetical protein
MEREVKTVKARAGSKPAAARSPRARATVDKRTVEQRLADAQAQQAATSEILRVMSASPTDVQPVMNAVSREAAHLCHAHVARILVADGAQLIPLADYQLHGGAEIVGSSSSAADVDRRAGHRSRRSITPTVPLLDTEYPAARHNATEGACEPCWPYPDAKGEAATSSWPSCSRLSGSP